MRGFFENHAIFCLSEIKHDTLENSSSHCVLDRTKVKFIGEMNSILIRLSSNHEVFQIIDILVVDIPNFYSLILSRDSLEKLHVYFSN